jgi:hypothetical protein
MEFKFLLPLMQLKPRKEAFAIDTPLINSSLQQLRYLVAYTNMLMHFYMIVPMPFGALVSFLRQKISITLQRMQMSSILSRVVVIGLASSRLPPLQDTTPITMTDLL